MGLALIIAIAILGACLVALSLCKAAQAGDRDWHHAHTANWPRRHYGD
jgi:hypothetical protein